MTLLNVRLARINRDVAGSLNATSPKYVESRKENRSMENKSRKMQTLLNIAMGMMVAFMTFSLIILILAMGRGIYTAELPEQKYTATVESIYTKRPYMDTKCISVLSDGNEARVVDGLILKTGDTVEVINKVDSKGNVKDRYIKKKIEAEGIAVK